MVSWLLRINIDCNGENVTNCMKHFVTSEFKIMSHGLLFLV
jgi:hypothetical protein